jgi:cobaltochelatase CobN
MSRFLPLAAIAALAVLFTPTAGAAKLVGIVSDRSAPALAAAAEAFDEAHPGHELVLRTPEQLAERTDDAVTDLWADADAVLFGAVFGEAAPRFVRLLESNPPPAAATVFAVSSDRRLTTASRIDGERPLADLDASTLDELTAQPDADDTLSDHFSALVDTHPDQAEWLRGRHYWQARGRDNLSALIAWLLAPHADGLDPAPPGDRAAVRWLRDGDIVDPDALGFEADRGIVAVLDYDTGDRVGHLSIHETLCAAIRERGLQCVSVLAQWGETSVEALDDLRERLDPAPLAGIVTLQDFVVGGGEGRQQAIEAFGDLDIPVLKAVRLTERTEAQWRLSPEGLPFESVHYRVAMPEVQGQSQPSVIAAAEPPRIDELTGVRMRLVHPIGDEIDAVAERLANWRSLRTTDNADKKLGVIFYNHPPGRHNIGADNLDVVDSLYDLLHDLKDRGYTVGELPESPEALLDMLQERAVNLPENRKELAAMSGRVRTVPGEDYREWFRTLPEAVQREMTGGPLARLIPEVRSALDTEAVDIARDLIERTLGDTEHMLEGVDHDAKARALDLLDQLRDAYGAFVDGEEQLERIERLTAALQRTGIEALGGWGEAPGYVMAHEGELLLPGIRFGNVFVGPQPPRGWELDEELLHANTTFPPPHQYLAFYEWLRNDFEADALVHFGRHSTYEFLPGNRVGMRAEDYSRLAAGNLPGVYPYIIDGVGEGIQAKRRGLAVIVDHLTPPLATTPLYDRLLELRQLVESYESAEGGGQDTPAQKRALKEIRRLIDELDLKQALVKSMQDILDKRDIAFEDVEGHLFVHEVGHYLTKMQEDFMPQGLHIFGRPWKEDAIDTMMESIGDSAQDDRREKLTISPEREMEGLFAGLDGRFVAPGKGNDPVRSPEVLPTGRNFHALNGSLLPTRLAWKLGSDMAGRAREDTPRKGSEAVVLWASDTVRDDGAMVAFGLNMLGIKPVWNSRGILQGIERMNLPDDRVRRDVLFTTSGLFRDLYQNLLVWLDRAVLLALDASSETIRERHPDLRPALANALEPLGELRNPGSEPIEANRIAEHWIAAARSAVDNGTDPAAAGREAALRVFGDAPGGYGAGVNRLTERSGAWSARSEIADAYVQRMGHAYGDGVSGQSAHAAFKEVLGGVERTYLGRASNVYGLLDNNDAFDYLGGLNLAVEDVSGEAPRNRVVDHSDPDNPSVEALESAVLSELQGRYLNPAWIKPLMSHGYSGARTMGSKFLENFWGWQVTNPDMITDGMWREIKSVYIDDRHDLGLDDFLEEGQSAHVKANMLAVMLVAMQKDFWNADAETAERIARDFAELVIDNSLPGSGHTRPDHPMLDWIEPKLTERQREAMREIRADAKVTKPEREQDPSSVRRIEAREQQQAQQEKQAKKVEEKQSQQRDTEADQPWDWTVLTAALLGLVFLTGGLAAGLRGGAKR